MKSKAKGITGPRKVIQVFPKRRYSKNQRTTLQIFIKSLSAPHKGLPLCSCSGDYLCPLKKKKENICLILCQRFCVINSTPWNLPAAACAVLASADAFVLMVLVMTVLSPAFIVSDFRALGSGIYILPATL